ATNEELRSANEEVLSNNEELQSTNEELETAKEELQSGNEELTTLNEELQNRNLELSVAINDMNNLLSNVNVPILMLTIDVRVRHFTPPEQKMLNLLPSDLGRKIGEVRPNLHIANLEQSIHETIESVTPTELELQDQQGRWHMMRVRPYKTIDNKIDGAVVSFVDIDLLKRSLERSRHLAEITGETAREALVVMDETLRVQTANPSFYQMFQVPPEETANQFLYDLGGRVWNIPALRAQLEDILAKNKRLEGFEVEAEFPSIGRKTMLLDARPMDLEPGQHWILLSIRDVTEQKCVESALHEKAELLDLAHDGIFIRDMSGVVRFW